MARFGLKSIRGRTALVAVLASAVAMTLIVATVAWGTFSALRTSTLDIL